MVGISPHAKEALANYLWPGNVRELENAVEHAFVLADDLLLGIDHFPPEIRHVGENGTPPPPVDIDPNREEKNVRKALFASKGNRSKAAGILGMHRSSLWRKMREYRIDKGFGKNH